MSREADGILKLSEANIFGWHVECRKNEDMGIFECCLEKQY